MEEYKEQEGINLLDLWRIIVKRRYLIISIFSFVTGLTLIVSLAMKPVYRATVQVLIESENPQVVKMDDVTQTDARSQDYYQTQYKILQSRTLAKDVIRNMALDTNPEFTGEENWISTIIIFFKQLFMYDKLESEVADPSDPLNPYVKQYLENLKISPVLRSRLVDISFDGHDRELIAKIANEHAKAYVNMTLGFRLTGSKDAANWLIAQTTDLKTTLRKSEERLQEFTRKNDMLALENMITASQYTDGKGSSEANILAQKMAELNSQLTAVRTERIGAETLYKQIRQLSANPEMIESISEISGNRLIQQLKSDYIGLTRQLSDMREKFGDKHPKMISMREEMANLQSKIKLEVAKIAKGVELQYQVALAKEKNLEDSLEQIKRNATRLNEKAIQYLELKGDVDLNRDLYNKVLKRAKETTLTSGLEATNVVVVDAAEVPLKPIYPRILLNFAIACIIGLTLGLTIAFTIEYFDATLNTPEDLEAALKIPCRGIVERQEELSEHKDIKSILLSNKHGLKESVQNLAVNVLFSCMDNQHKILLITSLVPEEGKSTVSTALALVLAQMNRKILLIDADIRKPKANKLLGLNAERGLSDVILGEIEAKAAIQNTWNSNFQFLSCGKHIIDPTQLLSSQRMKHIIRNIYLELVDIIIIDSPPILAVADPQILSTISDEVLLVVKGHETSKNAINRGLSILNNVKANVMGGVLNMVNIKKDIYYYDKHHNSKYYYYADEHKS